MRISGLSAIEIVSMSVVAAIIFSGQQSARASRIPGVTVNTGMLSSSGTNVVNMINGSGLPGNIPALTGTHAQANTANVWSSGYKTGYVYFDLHGRYRLDGMSIWPFNGNNTICAKDVLWYASTDGTNYTLISGAPSLLPQGPWASPVSPIYYVLPSVQATHLRLDIYSNYGHTSYSGFAEIQFDGAFVPGPLVDVDLDEFAILSAWWGESACDGTNAFCEGVDYNRSGNVDLADLIFLIEYWLE